MLLSKAIELISLYLRDPDCPFSSDARDAVQLGIEALKWVKRDQDRCMPGTVNPLPGQTEE